MVAQVDENCWYGFLDYGDFQIQYDETKKNWKYDEGGRAWINEELMPGIFLWQLFLRTGRLDVFRRAEAMSRHAEVDMYHIGPLRGIGTRHNVRHWGCGDHEIRQSMAGNKRYFHLITGDERTREIILDECQDVGKASVFLRKARNKPGRTAYADNMDSGTLGPGLSSYFWNWLAVWEFTGCPKHRDMVLNGMRYMASRDQPYGFAGISMSYRINFETGALELIVPHGGKPPMANLFGSCEIWLELAGLAGIKEWDEALSKYGALHLIDTYKERHAVAPEATGHGSGIVDRRLSPGAIELIAFAGAKRKDRKIVSRAIDKLVLVRRRAIDRGEIDNRRDALWGRMAIGLIGVLKREGMAV
jgi:hypothetical protein